MKVPHFYITHSRYGTHIIDGGWDTQHCDESVGFFRLKESEKLAKIDNYLFYESIQKWINEGVEWEETRCYQVLSKERSPSEAENRGEKLRQLRSSLQSKGYLHQRKLNRQSLVSRMLFWRPPPEHGEIVVDIGRDGEILFDDGKHRFCIAKAMGLQLIPVRVLVRHREWQELREEINSAGEPDSLSDRAKRNLGHPDLEDIVPEHWKNDNGECEYKIE